MITNINTYKFIDLADLASLREELLTLTTGLGLKGSILLSPEGININVAGTVDKTEAFKTSVQEIATLGAFTFKESLSKTVPFTRMLVKIKPEIITFKVDGVKPHEHTSPRISPKELKSWYEQGKEFVILDTRNDFEYKFGTFKNAINPHLKHFTAFPEAIDKLDPRLKNLPVVTFCTGGVRCEKAAPLMEQHGFKEVYQLDGGILNYFEECGGDFYDGNCFIFDHRIAVDSNLQETGIKQCNVCADPVTVEEQKSPLYVLNKSCPHCYTATGQATAYRDRPNITTQRGTQDGL